MSVKRKIDLTEEYKFGRTFCPAPFIENMIDVATPDRLCCRDRPSGLAHSVIRDKMLAGESIPDCAYCYELENKGTISFRQTKIKDAREKHAEALQQSVSQWLHTYTLPPARVYQITSSNVCNYACIMCTPGRSSTLAKSLGIISHIKKIDISDLQIPSGSEVALAGGEPFLIKDYLDLLERMPADVLLTISTNGSVINRRLIRLLQKFSRLYLMISIDAVGELYPTIRINGDWPTVAKNAETLARYFDNTCVITTIQKDNINHLLPIYQWCCSKNLAWRAHLLTQPAHLHWKKQSWVDLAQLEQIDSPDIRTRNLLKSIIQELAAG